ncbi:MAG: CopG family transcriptional regulator [Bacteroidota bacterium]
MSKTLTLRIEDDLYNLFKLAAEGERRSISNYIEFAALAHTLGEVNVSDEEMEEIKPHFSGIRKGLADVKKGRYSIVQ